MDTMAEEDKASARLDDFEGTLAALDVIGTRLLQGLDHASPVILNDINTVRTTNYLHSVPH